MNGKCINNAYLTFKQKYIVNEREREREKKKESY